jgi:hypothetical protein
MLANGRDCAVGRVILFHLSIQCRCHKYRSPEKVYSRVTKDTLKARDNRLLEINFVIKFRLTSNSHKRERGNHYSLHVRSFRNV